MASTLEKVTQERNDEKNSQGRSSKAYLKTDAELKRLFGLTKDLRVRLTRVPGRLGPGGGVGCFGSLGKSDGETGFTGKEEERKQGVDKKRKSKIVKMDHTKRRRTESAYHNTAVNGGTEVTSSQPGHTLPASDVSLHDFVPGCNKTREEKRTGVQHCTHENQEKDALSLNADFEQSHSFNKNYTEDIFPMTPPELEETIRDEKIRRLKQMLREKEAALEEMRKKMHRK